jgi:hypothetical protein
VSGKSQNKNRVLKGHWKTSANSIVPSGTKNYHSPQPATSWLANFRRRSATIQFALIRVKDPFDFPSFRPENF